MRIMNKLYVYQFNVWNYLAHKYDTKTFVSKFPKVFKTFSEDMDEKVNCCQCYRAIRFGETYTSNEVHTELGMGFAVCPQCYEDEWERRRKYGKD